MRSGDLRHRITLYAPTESRGTSGGIVTTYISIATVWANFREPVGKNYYAAMQEHNEVPAELRIRWRADVNSTWRVGFGNRTFEINQAQDPDGKRREQVLYCKELR
ncbi:MAG: phage head closure protein [Dehalococcoidia bacterium]|jgi:SPP1 family predicted phage head-tail adaptor